MALRVKFNNKKNMQQVEFKAISSAVVQLTGNNIPHNTSGFKMYRLNGDFLGDYSDYTKIVKETKNVVQFGKA